MNVLPVKSRNLLVVEDDPDVLATLCEVLEMEGFATVPTRNGLEALEALKNPTLPGLVLLDLMMPLMDGYEFLRTRALRRELAALPVVVMSAHGNLEDRPGLGSVAAFLRKPFTVDALLEVVKLHLPSGR